MDFCTFTGVLKDFAAASKDKETPKESTESTSNASYPADYISVFSLVTNTELQPVKALMTYSLVCETIT